ncbi:hypothetical protein ABZP36_020353 [Zizania latifolia]
MRSAGKPARPVALHEPPENLVFGIRRLRLPCQTDRHEANNLARAFDEETCRCTNFSNRLTNINKLLENYGNDGFARGPRGFVKAVEQELKELKGDEEKVPELVQRTTEYYHAGATKDKIAHPLQRLHDRHNGEDRHRKRNRTEEAGGVTA